MPDFLQHEEVSPCAESFARASIRHTTRAFLVSQKKDNNPSTVTMPDECSVCLEELVRSTALQCGHVFCIGCVQSMAAQNRVLTCPLCRVKTTMMLPLFQANDQQASFSADQLAFIRDFNAQNAGQGNWVQEERFLVSQKLSGVFIITGIVLLLYLISPVDLIPDAIPVIGWVDDLVIVLFFLAAWHYIAQRLRGQILRA